MQKVLALVFCFPNKFELLSMSDFIHKKRHKILRQLNVRKTNAYVNQVEEKPRSKTHSLVTAVHVIMKV